MVDGKGGRTKCGDGDGGGGGRRGKEKSKSCSPHSSKNSWKLTEKRIWKLEKNQVWCGLPAKEPSKKIVSELWNYIRFFRRVKPASFQFESIWIDSREDWKAFNLILIYFSKTFI